MVAQGLRNGSRTSLFELLGTTSYQLMNFLWFHRFTCPGVSPLRFRGLRLGLIESFLLGLGGVFALETREESSHNGRQR